MANRVTESIISITSRALVAEVLGDRRRRERRPDPDQRGLIRGRDDHDGAAKRIAKIAFDELADLAASLTDERDHVDVRGRRCGRSSRAARTCRRRIQRRCRAAGPVRTAPGCRGRGPEVDALSDPRAARRRRAEAPSSIATRRPSSSPRPSSGLPSPSMTRPRSFGPTATRTGRSGRADAAFRADPAQLTERHQQRPARRGTRRPRSATGAGGCPRRRCTARRSPPAVQSTSTIRPIRSPTRPRRRARSLARIASVAARAAPTRPRPRVIDALGSGVIGIRPEARLLAAQRGRTISRASCSWESHRGVDLAKHSVRTITPPRRRAGRPWTSMCSMPPELGGLSGSADAVSSSRSSGLTAIVTR